MTLLDMAKESRKKWLWQKSLFVYIQKAVLQRDKEVRLLEPLKDVERGSFNLGQADGERRQLQQDPKSNGGYSLATFRSAQALDVSHRHGPRYSRRSARADIDEIVAEIGSKDSDAAALSVKECMAQAGLVGKVFGRSL